MTRVPSYTDAVGAVARLSWKRTIRSKRLLLAAVAVVALVGAIAVSAYTGTRSTAAAYDDLVRMAALRILVIVLPFLFASGAISDDVDSRVWPFWAVRAAPRTAVALGKLIPAAALSMAFSVAAVLLGYAILIPKDSAAMVPLWSNALHAAAATGALALVYSAICFAFSALLVEAAGVAAVLYLVVIELGLSMMPGYLRVISARYHALLLSGLSPDAEGLLVSQFAPPHVGPWISAIMLAVFGFGATAIALSVVARSEYRYATGGSAT